MERRMEEIGEIKFQSGETVSFYLGHNGDYVQAKGPNTGLHDFDELGAAIFWAREKFGAVESLKNALYTQLDMTDHCHNGTHSPKDVAELLDQDVSGIRAKAAQLHDEGGAALAYKNAGGWQITHRGVERLRDWPDARKNRKKSQ